MCKADIGYEVRGGGFADWQDGGGFPNCPCDNPHPGYKFSGLTPATTYVLSIRAYRLVAGVKDSYSTESSITCPPWRDPQPDPNGESDGHAYPDRQPDPHGESVEQSDGDGCAESLSQRSWATPLECSDSGCSDALP